MITMPYHRKNAKNTKSAPGTLQWMVIMDVSQIRYTQNTISDTFSDGTPLQDTINMLKTKEIKAHNIPPIRVGVYQGHYRTIDNRRLYCFKSSNVKKISVKYISNIGNLAEFYKKNTSNDDGWTVTVRNEKRKANAGKWCYCNLCDIYLTVGNKTSHSNGRRHRENAAEKKVQDKEAEAKLRTEAIKRKAIAAAAWKPKICAAPVPYAREIELKQTISQKTAQIKSLNTKLKKIAQKNGANKKNPANKKNTANKKSAANKKNTANKKNSSNKKNGANKKKMLKLKKMARECKLNCVEDVTVISWKPLKPPICAVEKAGEMELEQLISAKSNEINDLNSKLKEMKKEINAYKIKLKDMEQRRQCSDVAIDIDVDVEVEVNEEMKKNNCALFAIVPICCVFGLGFGGLCLYFKKYI